MYRVLVGKPEGKRQLERPRRTWEDHIKMAVHEVGCWVMDWIELSQVRDRWQALVSISFSPYRCVAITNIYYDCQTQLSFY